MEEETCLLCGDGEGWAVIPDLWTGEPREQPCELCRLVAHPDAITVELMEDLQENFPHVHLHLLKRMEESRRGLFV